jgi:hypothetical protein
MEYAEYFDPLPVIDSPGSRKSKTRPVMRIERATFWDGSSTRRAWYLNLLLTNMKRHGIEPWESQGRVSSFPLLNTMSFTLNRRFGKLFYAFSCTVNCVVGAFEELRIQILKLAPSHSSGGKA